MFKNKRIILLIITIIISILGYIIYKSTIIKKEEIPKKEIITEEGFLPEKFNLADIIDIEIEDQGELGLCWAFAVIKSLETNIILKTR